MRFSRLFACCAIAALFSSAAQAQSVRDRIGQSRQQIDPVTAKTQALGEPLPADATKRTWQFMTEFEVPEFEADLKDCDGAIERFTAYVQAYNKRVDDFFAGPVEARKIKADRGRFKYKIRPIDGRINRYIDTFDRVGTTNSLSGFHTREDDICIARNQYYNILAAKEGLAAFKRLYPDMAELDPVIALADSAMEAIGGREAIEVQVEKNRAQALSEVRMRAAVASDPQREGRFRSGFQQAFPDRTYLKQSLISRGWVVYRHWLTGRVEYSETESQIASKLPDGRCFLTTLSWTRHEAWTGKSGDRFRSMYDRQILCENL